MIRRRGLVLASPALPWAARAETAVAVTDLAGRAVRLPRPARRIVLTQGRHLPVMALVHPDPVSLVVGWASDLRQANAPEYDQLRRLHPAVDRIPLVGRGAADTLSFESIIGLQPDLVLLSRYTASASPGAGDDGLVRRLDRVGIPAAVIDFFADPLRDSETSLGILGALLGRPDRAAAFNAHYRRRLDEVRRRVGDQEPKTSILMHTHAGGWTRCGVAWATRSRRRRS